MKETCELEIFEIFTIDSFTHREIGCTVKNSACMRWVVVRIRVTLSQYIKYIGSCLFDNGHEKIAMR